MAGLTREQRAAKRAAEEQKAAELAARSADETGPAAEADRAEAARLLADAEALDGDRPTFEGCIFMYREGVRAEVNRNSVEIMRDLGWREKERWAS